MHFAFVGAASCHIDMIFSNWSGVCFQNRHIRHQLMLFYENKQICSEGVHKMSIRCKTDALGLQSIFEIRLPFYALEVGVEYQNWISRSI